MIVQLPRMPEIRPLFVMTRVFDELVEGFTDYGYTIKIPKNLDEMEDGGLIFLDDAAGEYIQNKEVYIQMGLKCPKSIFICWYWKDTSFKPFQYMIYTGEYAMSAAVYHHGYEYMMKPYYVPLKLRANESPALVGTYERYSLRDFCYIGWGYKMDWIPKRFTGLYYRVTGDNRLTYAERKEIYLSSVFALGFQADENITCGHLSQRLFEGLAYGCIFLCENKLASIYTDGIIVHVKSAEDLEAKMEYYKMHPELIREKQLKGYDWIRRYGTNREAARDFLDKIKRFYNLPE